jgi:succinyl-CoA synthetase alpha subunit
MKAKKLSDLLKSSDRVAVSNITGREARSVTVASQRYCPNIVGGWALGKNGLQIEVPGRDPIPVFSDTESLTSALPREQWPNKVIIYSPPQAVYAEAKEIVDHFRDTVETIFIITEHVSVEVMSKIQKMCSQANIDVVGGN